MRWLEGVGRRWVGGVGGVEGKAGWGLDGGSGDMVG